jgi:hypothetical protein
VNCKLFCLLLNVSLSQLGLGTEFRSEKIPRNRLGTVSVIPRKKALIPRHSEFRGRACSEARSGTERNETPQKKLVLGNSSKINLQNDVGFSSMECFGTAFREFASILVPRNGIPS